MVMDCQNTLGIVNGYFATFWQFSQKGLITFILFFGDDIHKLLLFNRNKILITFLASYSFFGVKPILS